MQQVLLVGLGGAFGAAARYGIGKWAAQAGHIGFPWGTWAANLMGCFLIGLVAPWLADGHARLWALVVVGFLGAFTTFSTFSLDTLLLLQNGKPGVALANALGAVALGLLLVWAGMQLARLSGAP